MKLIIDIPEDLYKWIKDEYDNPNEEVAYSAIEHGIPYEEPKKNCFGCQGDKDFGCEDCLNKPKGDCISRKQVLDELLEHQYSQDFCKEHGIEYSIHSGMVRIIVNRAPTVEPIQQDRRIPVDGIMDLDAVIEELKTKAEYNKQLLQWLEELKAYREKAGRDCSTCARYSEFQKDIPEECKGCKHNYFSNYVELK